MSVVSREGRTGGFSWVGKLAFNLGKPLANTFPRRIRKSGAKNPQFKKCFRPWGAEDGELLFVVWGSGQTLGREGDHEIRACGTCRYTLPVQSCMMGCKSVLCRSGVQN